MGHSVEISIWNEIKTSPKLTSQCMSLSCLTSFHSIQLQNSTQHAPKLFELKNWEIFSEGGTAPSPDPSGEGNTAPGSDYVFSAISLHVNGSVWIMLSVWNMLNYQTSLMFLLTQQLSFCERVESLLCTCMSRDQRLHFVSQMRKHGLAIWTNSDY